MPYDLRSLLESLYSTAQARPDLITPGSTGSLENARPYTYMGRVNNANRPMPSLGELLAQIPDETPDAEGMQLSNIVNKLIGGAAGGALGNEAGIFRDLGLKRQSGRYNPHEFAEALKKQPNYERYKHLSQLMTERKMGKEFPVYRGVSANDPLIMGDVPKATAVSTSPFIASNFAEEGMVSGKATPKSVLGILPERGTYFNKEKEYLINPRTLKDTTYSATGENKMYLDSDYFQVQEYLRNKLLKGTNKPE